MNISDQFRLMLINQLEDYHSMLESEHSRGIESISPAAHERFHAYINRALTDVAISLDNLRHSNELTNT